MEKLKISVVTAVYNSEKTVADAINSVASQTYNDVEHVIIEGRSTDGSLDVIQRYKHDRMNVLSEPDDGIYDALNKGIRRSKGDIIGFVHSDDFLANNEVLSTVAKAFKNPEVEAVFSDLDYVSQEDHSRVIRHWSTGPFEKSRLKRGWMPAHPTLYVRNDIYERFGLYDTEFGIAADYDFILRFFSQVMGKTVYIPEVLYKMRIGGVSNRNWSKIKQKMREDLYALRKNNVGGIQTLAFKNLSKIGQFRPRSKHAV